MGPEADPGTGAWVAAYSMSASEVSNVDSVTQLNVPAGNMGKKRYYPFINQAQNST